MNRETWMWMQASVALMAAASAKIRREAYDAALARIPASPPPLRNK